MLVSKFHTANYPPHPPKPIRAASPSHALISSSLNNGSSTQPPPLSFHPNVVPIMRIDESENAFYVVCEKQPFSFDKMTLFSPQVLEANCMLKPFLMYQFLQVYYYFFSFSSY